MYFSDFELKSKEDSSKRLAAKLITVFSIRASIGNQKLFRSQANNDTANINSFTSMPKFGMEYRKVKKQKMKQINLKGNEFTISDTLIFGKKETAVPQ